MESEASYREVLRNREFTAMFAAGGLSVVGDQLARIAVALLVFERSGSTFAAAAVYACSYLSWLLGGPVLSAFADRLRRRRLMVVCDLARMLLLTALAVPNLPLWAVFAVLGLVGLLAPPFDAARSAMIADILDGEAYVRGTTLNQSLGQVGQVVGFVSGGALVALTGVSGALLANAATFGVSAVLLLAVVAERPAPGGTQRSESLLRETGEGARLVASTPRLRTLLGWGLLSAGLVIAPEGLAVAVGQELDGGPVAVGLLTAAVPVGFVLGSLALARLPGERRERLFAPMVLLSAVPLLLTPLAPSLEAVLLLWVIAGLGNALQLIANASFVLAVPRQLRGRAFGIAVTLLMAVQGVVLLAAGALADQMGARPAVAGLAGLGVLLLAGSVLYRHGSRAAVLEKPRQGSVMGVS